MTHCPLCTSRLELLGLSLTVIVIPDPDRIDHIEVLAGPDELVGFGRDLWDLERADLKEHSKALELELAAEISAAEEHAAGLLAEASNAVRAAAQALEMAHVLAPSRGDLRKTAGACLQYSRAAQQQSVTALEICGDDLTNGDYHVRLCHLTTIIMLLWGVSDSLWRAGIRWSVYVCR